AFVVVRELLHVSECDLARQDRIVVCDIGLRIMRSVLKLDVHPAPKLFEVEAAPIHPDLVADPSSLFVCRSFGLSHLSSSRGRSPPTRALLPSGIPAWLGDAGGGT